MVLQGGRHDVRLGLLGQARQGAEAPLPRRPKRPRRVSRRPVGQRRGGLGEAVVGGVAGASADDGIAEEDGAAAAPRFAVSVEGGLGNTLQQYTVVHQLADLGLVGLNLGCSAT